MRARITTIERLEAVARAALLGGYGTISTWSDTGTLRRRVELRIAMDCEQPYEYELHSRTPAVHGAKRPPYTVLVQSRCRKCSLCRERKRMFWTARARAEYLASPLTLFGTLTFSPEMDVRLDAEMQLFRDPITRQKRLENVFDLPAPELFRERVKFAGNEVTKWLKRLRSSDRSRRLGLRYLLVAEAHASGRTSELKRGRPHFHCLIHQAEGAPIALPSEWAVDPSGQVRADKHGNPFLAEHAFLKRAWQGGFSSFAMCRTPQAAGYMLKYLTKEESAVRIRASFRYGANGSESIEPQAKEDISTSQQGEK